MENYIGTKMVKAEPMTRGAYNEFRGWTIPADENPSDEGYVLEYLDGYVSWSPKKQFEDAYRDCMGMTFGIALELLKKGVKVAREGWNGKGMFIVYNEFGLQKMPCIWLKYSDGSHSMWTPSVKDCLAEDWVIVE